MRWIGSPTSCDPRGSTTSASPTPGAAMRRAGRGKAASRGTARPCISRCRSAPAERSTLKEKQMTTRMISRCAVCGIATAALALAGCANMSERERGTAAGAGIGAGVGAVLSSATGGKAGTGAVVGGALGAIAGNVWSKRQEDRRIAMEQATRGTGVEVTRTQDNQLKLNIPNDISFDTNSATIKPQMRSVLDPFVNTLKDDPNARLTIVGHTDSTGSDAVNNPLSVERAQSVRDYLAGKGVSPTRVQTAGHGEREPIADNSTDAGRARNRRVEIYLREPGA